MNIVIAQGTGIILTIETKTIGKKFEEHFQIPFPVTSSQKVSIV